MLASGPITTLPLLMFAAGVRQIPLSLVGMLQYVNPTLQISIGVLLYQEPFTRVQLLGFSLVWSALVLFAIDGYGERLAANSQRPTVNDRRQSMPGSRRLR